MKNKPYTDLEKELLFALADMVTQNCGSHHNKFDENDEYESGFISCHKAALMLLVEQGVMVELKDGYGRGYWAKLRFPGTWQDYSVVAAIKEGKKPPMSPKPPVTEEDVMAHFGFSTENPQPTENKQSRSDDSK